LNRKRCDSGYISGGSIRERRKEQKTEGFQQKMKVRAQMEGTISEAKRFFGF
jgi:hypothetical protein